MSSNVTAGETAFMRRRRGAERNYQPAAASSILARLLFDYYHLGDFGMRWRDIRFEKPTEADGDKIHREVVVVCKKGYCRTRTWDDVDDGDVVAWMPLFELPAFDRIPDPPEGWRFVEKGEAFDKRAKFWFSRRWENTHNLAVFDPHSVYIVPIDPPKPPEPQYRPFANAAEFEPYRNKWWRHKTSNSKNPPLGYSDTHWGGMPFGLAFDKYEFEDGSPFGVRVEP